MLWGFNYLINDKLFDDVHMIRASNCYVLVKKLVKHMYLMYLFYSYQLEIDMNIKYKTISFMHLIIFFSKNNKKREG